MVNRDEIFIIIVYRRSHDHSNLTKHHIWMYIYIYYHYRISRCIKCLHVLFVQLLRTCTSHWFERAYCQTRDTYLGIFWLVTSVALHIAVPAQDPCNQHFSHKYFFLPKKYFYCIFFKFTKYFS